MTSRLAIGRTDSIPTIVFEAPWWTISVALHAMVLSVFMFMVWKSRPTEERVVIKLGSHSPEEMEEPEDGQPEYEPEPGPGACPPHATDSIEGDHNEAFDGEVGPSLEI